MKKQENNNQKVNSPDFIVIGPGRSGSTFLYQIFKEHPEICMPLNTKETNYFNHEYHRGLSWYQSFFKNCDPKKITGEISNTYIYNDMVPERIKEVLPTIKLITVLRNPFQRILSAYQFRKSVGEISPDTSFKEALTLFPDLISDNYYGSQLQKYFSIFPPHNILVTFYDDLERSPELFLKNIFEFLQVDSKFESTTIYRKVNQSKSLRIPLFAPFVRFIADTLRKLQLFRLLKKSKESGLFNHLLFTDTDIQNRREIMPTEIVDELNKVFIPEINKVEELTMKDLSHWYN